MFRGNIEVPWWLAGLIGAGVIAAIISACGLAKATEPFKDSAVYGNNNDPALVFHMPDGFSNGATKCLVPGIRVAVLYHNDSAYGSVAMVADKNCR